MTGPPSTMRGIPSSKLTLLVVATGTWSVGTTLVVNRLWGLYCPFRLLTGLDCPGCGATRAIIALAEGNISLAVHQNLLVVLAPAIGSAVYLASRIPFFRAQNARTFIGVGLLVVLIAWAVARNIPGLDFLRSG